MDVQTYQRLFVGRFSDFACQQEDGGYRRVGRRLTEQDLRDHLMGRWTLGTYVRNEQGFCSFAVFDADSEDGFQVLAQLQARLVLQGILSSLEKSRRGGHLWVCFSAPALASHVRVWLLPFCPDGVEFYPKQAEGAGYGSLMRLPLGVHRRSGKRYPFVEWHEGRAVPTAQTVGQTLEWLTTVPRAEVPTLPPINPSSTRTQKTSFSTSVHTTPNRAFPLTIREWCAGQDAMRVIGAYVDLNTQGVGQCPFSWHHAHGRDKRPSFKVYHPGTPGGSCWYCYVWQQGGSVFDFLRYWHNLDARDLWKRIREGELTP